LLDLETEVEEVEKLKSRIVYFFFSAIGDIMYSSVPTLVLEYCTCACMVRSLARKVRMAWLGFMLHEPFSVETM
jgi:hypothetical protein